VKSVFKSLAAYPELIAIQSAWQTIRDEAIATLPHAIAIRDARVRPQMWQVLPLMPEPEDRAIIGESIIQHSRQLAPNTIQQVERIPNLRAYAFSTLKPGGHIRLHRHENPRVTATLCLQTGGQSYIQVDRQRQDFQEGEFVIFDYRLLHEVFNQGQKDRIVLLILLDIKSSSLKKW